MAAADASTGSDEVCEAADDVCCRDGNGAEVRRFGECGRNGFAKAAETMERLGDLGDGGEGEGGATILGDGDGDSVDAGVEEDVEPAAGAEFLGSLCFLSCT